MTIHPIEHPVPNDPGRKLSLLAKLCATGDCPTVYVTDRNTVVVQGYTVRSQDATQHIPAGEQLVEIPPELLAIAAQKLSA